jgi:hypothetical protein
VFHGSITVGTKEVTTMKQRDGRIRAEKTWMFVFAVLFMFSMTGIMAASAATASKDEKKLDREATELDHTAGTPKGETVVMQKLEKEFNVSESTITGLRGQKLGFGEIAIVLGLASKEPGGITDANISSIMTLRAGPPVMGWGEIAGKLGVNLGSVVSSVRRVDTGSHNEIRTKEMTEHGKGMMNGERTGRMGGPERMNNGGGHGRY